MVFQGMLCCAWCCSSSKKRSKGPCDGPAAGACLAAVLGWVEYYVCVVVYSTCNCDDDVEQLPLPIANAQSASASCPNTHASNQDCLPFPSRRPLLTAHTRTHCPLVTVTHAVRSKTTHAQRYTTPVLLAFHLHMCTTPIKVHPGSSTAVPQRLRLRSRGLRERLRRAGGGEAALPLGEAAGLPRRGERLLPAGLSRRLGGLCHAATAGQAAASGAVSGSVLLTATSTMLPLMGPAAYTVAASWTDATPA